MKFQKSKIIKFLGVVQLITFLATNLFANDGPLGMTQSKALETALKENPSLMLAEAQRDASDGWIDCAGRYRSKQRNHSY